VPPHCRDAPWGVSGAGLSTSQSSRSRGGSVAKQAIFSASETPHGASLQWGCKSLQSGMQVGGSESSHLFKHPLSDRRAACLRGLPGGIGLKRSAAPPPGSGNRLHHLLTDTRNALIGTGIFLPGAPVFLLAAQAL